MASDDEAELGERVQRDDPHAQSAVDDSTGHEFVLDVTRPLDDQPTQEAVEKKKKKKRSKGSKKKRAVTGFEENYADPPISVAEHDEEVEDVYNPSRSFAERIESCIQRYRAKRRFDPERKNMFDKYLVLGGVDAGQKAFSGGLGGGGDMSDKTASEIAAIVATDFVSRDKENAGAEDSDWMVDFESVAKCFFSSRLPECFDLMIEKVIPSATDMIKNFLNYVLHHNACPEYNDQVYAAREICDLAAKELNAIRTLGSILPGDFNVACSTLYGGYYSGMWAGYGGWAADLDLRSGMADDRAKKVIMVGIAAYGTEEQFRLAQGELRIIDEDEEGAFEIMEIIPASEETKTLYKRLMKEAEPIKPLGKLKVREWDNPFRGAADRSDDEEDDEKSNQLETYEVLVEDDILQHCFAGIKVVAHVRTLTGGMKFFDTVTNMCCSFYTNLEQEMLSGWKEPRALPPRPDKIHPESDEEEAEEDGF